MMNKVCEKPKVSTVKNGYWREDNNKHPIKPAWCITWYGLHIRFYGDGLVHVWDETKNGYKRVYRRKPIQAVKP